DRAERDAAAAMAGDAGRLVQGQQARVLEHDRRFHRLQEAGWWGPLVARLAETNRRNADFIARGQLALRLGPATIDPDLARAHQFVDQRARGPLELAQQEVVEALAVAVVGHANGARARAGRGGGV